MDNDSLQQACNHLVESLNNYEMVRCSSEHPRSANLDSSNDELVDSALSAILDCRFVKIRHFREDLESSPRDLFNIIMNHQYTECSDPRDKVYSLQRLCYPSNVGNGVVPWDYGITAEQLFCRTLIIWQQRSRIQHVDLLRQALGLDWAVLKDLPQDHFTQNAEKVYGNVKLSLVGVRHVIVTKILQVGSASESTIFESLRDAHYKELLHFKFLTKWPVQVGQKVLYFRGLGSLLSSTRILKAGRWHTTPPFPSSASESTSLCQLTSHFHQFSRMNHFSLA